MAKSRLFSGVMRVSNGNTMSTFYTLICRLTASGKEA